MIRKDIIIIGGGGHSLSAADVIMHHSPYNLSGFIDVDPNASLGNLDVPWIGNDSSISTLNASHAHIGVGQIKSASCRKRLFNLGLASRLKFPVLASKQSVISKSAKIGDGSLIMHHTVINPCVAIGLNAIINTGSIVEHGVSIGNFCHIAPSATILGDVKIGNECFIGSGAVICEHVHIGDNVVIGAGSIVKKDITSGEMVK